MTVSAILILSIVLSIGIIVLIKRFRREVTANQIQLLGLQLTICGGIIHLSEFFNDYAIAKFFAPFGLCLVFTGLITGIAGFIGFSNR